MTVKLLVPNRMKMQICSEREREREMGGITLSLNFKVRPTDASS